MSALAPATSALRVASPLGGPVAPMPVDAAPSARPACAGGVCQPVVAVPGFEPRWRQSRNELALALLQRADIGPISGLAALVARSGIQVDFRPGALDDGVHHGWGRLLVAYRWQLGAPRER